MLKRTEKPSFKKYRQFFMIDLYPKSAARFPLSYEEVKRQVLEP